ncbi:hypothetical protein ACGFMK_42280 [Amycolatopsis sp. NPDC049252]|uniref:hypothetical protein n=1 Tax=Amycolatopsis sp. NPDC049252 TaxID=3363933 RepID=UPI0037155F5D
MSIAASVAARTVVGLYNLVKSRFSADPDAKAVLEAAEWAAEDSLQVRKLAETLEVEEARDSEFGRQMRAEWERASVEQRAATGGVTNQILGHVSGKVVQARDIQGGVSL